MRSIAFSFLIVLFGVNLNAQPLASGVTTLTLNAAGGTVHRSSLSYNPITNRYYSTLSGSSAYDINCFDGTTGLLDAAVTSGLDYRGTWWNPLTGQVEGNGFGSGPIVRVNTSGNCPSGTTTTIFPSNQPNLQSCGELDPDDYEIIYFYLGSVYRVDRNTGLSYPNIVLTGTPGGSNYAWRNMGYTGVTGFEYALYDRSNLEIHYYDKNTGAFSGSTAIGLALTSGLGYGFAYTNGQAWIYSSNVWNGFEVLGSSISPPPIPTMGEWGLIGFILLLGSIAVGSMYRRRKWAIA